MTQWNQIEDVLRRHHVTDVLVPGLIDRDEGPFPMFRPQPLVVHVVLGDEQALRLESVGQNDQLTVRVVDSISLEGVEFFERVEEETDDEIAQASWGEQLFGDGWSQLRCTVARPYTDGGSNAAEGVIKCLALELESRYWLFFDPTWTFGIKIGTAEDMRRWEQEH
ncbi:hypothetical protein GCM10022224_072450 [Nonomuraea antimicrobica]|uniref:Pyridoxamine 5'-phosphate oxidase n=1 Tax=Nonomuraea antimicrobica TaxID=561173 RepID=A0ABP7CZI2_9ACTN